MMIILSILLTVLTTSSVFGEDYDWSKVQPLEVNFIANKTPRNDIDSEDVTESRIGAGWLVPKIEDVPFQVGLMLFKRRSGPAWCGGSIIGFRWVLTAAHCLFGFEKIHLFAGILNRRTPEAEPNSVIITNIKKRHMIIHEDFNTDAAAYNDIGLIHLPETLIFTDQVKPINLLSQRDSDIIPRQNAYISGWGNFNNRGDSPDLLLFGIKKRLLSVDKCRRHLEFINLETIDPQHSPEWICGNPRTRQGSCSGDSGGPLVTSVNGTLTQIGIVSYGIHASEDNTCKGVLADMYTRITYFSQWICDKSGICPN